jgi:aqualysin 1
MHRIFTVAALVLAAATGAAAGEWIKAQDETLVVPGSYIVTLEQGVTVRSGAGVAGTKVSDLAVEIAAQQGGAVTHVYESVFPGFAIDHLTEQQAVILAEDPRVKRVEPNQVVRALATQSPATWGLDRIDQRTLPLSNSYTYNFTGQGVHAYIVDTGIRATHLEFAGRMGVGFTSVADGNGTNDCNGHGTHVAGTVGGSTWGVAKGVTLHAVRVLNCAGSGTTAGVIAGVDWVTSNHVKPAVANMSLGGGIQPALDDAVARSIAAGVVYTIAAGNSAADACSFSPARVGTALTVASSTGWDTRTPTSNWGGCVRLFAPGNAITSAWNTSDTASNTIGGTSMAAPHVAGVAALYLHQFGNGAPAIVNQAIVENATVGVLADVSGSPNRLLHALFGPPPAVNGARFISQSVPTNMVPGVRYPVSITMQNSGTTIWTSATLYRLGSQNPQDNLTWGFGRVVLPHDVIPNQAVTFHFTVTAPATPGFYNFQWRMVRELVAWFGDFTPNVTVTVGTVAGVNAARFVSQIVPIRMEPGELYDVSVTMQNVGTTTWTNALQYRLGSQAPPDNFTWGLARVALPRNVAPNETVTFQFTVVAPATPGAYSFQWRMVREGVAWFGDLTQLRTVRVRSFLDPRDPRDPPIVPQARP